MDLRTVITLADFMTQVYQINFVLTKQHFFSGYKLRLQLFCYINLIQIMIFEFCQILPLFEVHGENLFYLALESSFVKIIPHVINCHLTEIA